jgi:hypothetical protein
MRVRGDAVRGGAGLLGFVGAVAIGSVAVAGVLALAGYLLIGALVPESAHKPRVARDCPTGALAPPPAADARECVEETMAGASRTYVRFTVTRRDFDAWFAELTRAEGAGTIPFSPGEGDVWPKGGYDLAPPWGPPDSEHLRNAVVPRTEPVGGGPVVVVVDERDPARVQVFAHTYWTS